jgi:hypothetical protein
LRVNLSSLWATALGGALAAGRVWYALGLCARPEDTRPRLPARDARFRALLDRRRLGRAARTDRLNIEKLPVGTAGDGSARRRALPVRKLRPLRALLPYLARYRGQIALALLFLLLAASATLALPYAVKLLVDGGLAASAGDPARDRLASIRATSSPCSASRCCLAWRPRHVSTW